MAYFFNSYLGAVYYRSGLSVVQFWISRLIDPDTPIQPPRSLVQQVPFGQDGRSILNFNDASSSSSFSHGNFVPAQPTGVPPPLPSSPTNVTLALVNQTAAQKSCNISYPASQQGQSHLPTWTVRCVSKCHFSGFLQRVYVVLTTCKVNGVEKGIGIGKSQKVAKEEAAKQAWVAMGW
jgi:dsRNA-specific ribonuclease